MRPLNRIAGITVSLFFSLGLATLSSFSLLAHAQEPTPFEIHVIPQAEYAVSGQPFTYTIVITHTGRQPLTDVFVTVRTPQGTVFAKTDFANPNWLVSSVQRGEAGDITWLTQEPFAPGETMTFKLVVDLLPELAGQQLVNKEYTVATIDHSQLAVSGPPVVTQVLAPTPTPSSTDQATDTPVPTATSSPTSLVPTRPNPTTSSQASPVVGGESLSQVNTSITEAANNGPLTSTQDTSSTIRLITFIIVGLFVLVLLFIGLVWLRQRR